MDFDEHGRLFVVEMPGYPLDTAPTGRVKLLEDTDGDGRYETSRVFADGLVLPTGVMRWKKGVLVTAPPDLLYFEDTDGDGRADVRTVVLTGFAFTNPQHMVNAPVYGLDNWIYLAHEGPTQAVIYKDVFGDRGTPLRWPGHPQRPPSPVDRRGVRLRPDAGRLEAIAGTSQYGHGFDAWGRYFTTENADHARHEVMPAAWLARNPDLRLDSAMARIPDHGAAAQVFPITKRPTFELLTGAGEFTSACAITPYTGGAFPEANGATDGTSLFVAEPVHNLVHRDVLTPAGATFVARRAEPGREFLAAGDAWFRPVFLSVGPDGALYVVDYYRPRIEHPEWTSSDLQKDPSPMYEGRDRGRIYRVVRADAPASRPAPPRLGTASDADLVRALESPNLWWRRTAQRLLVDRHSRQAIAPLRTMAATSPSPLARVHALWTLDGLGALDDASIASAMRDATPGVRENAVRLAEPRLRSSASLAGRLVAMVDDPDARVRFVVLGALGSLATPDAAAARRTLLFAHLDDLWMQRAALSAGSAQAPALVDAMLRDRSRVLATPSEARAAFVRQLASIVGARQKPAEVARSWTPCPRPATPTRRGGAPPCSRAWRRARRGAAPRARSLPGARRPCWRCSTTPRPTCALARSPCCRSRALGDDAAWQAAVQRATATAGQGTDAQRRADAIALVSMDRPERRARLAGAVRVAARAGRRAARRGDRARTHRSATRSRRPAGPRRPGRVAVSRRTTRLDASSCRGGPGSRPRCGPAPATCSSTTRRARDCWSTRCPRGRSSRGAWVSGRSRISCSTRTRRFARWRGRCSRRIRASAPTRCAATRPPSTSRAIRRVARRCSPARAPPVTGAATPPAAISARTSPRCGIVRRRACWPTSSCRAGRSRSTTRPTSSSAGTATRPPASLAPRRRRRSRCGRPERGSSRFSAPRSRRWPCCRRARCPPTSTTLISPEEMADLLAFIRR